MAGQSDAGRPAASSSKLVTAVAMANTRAVLADLLPTRPYWAWCATQSGLVNGPLAFVTTQPETGGMTAPFLASAPAAPSISITQVA